MPAGAKLRGPSPKVTERAGAETTATSREESRAERRLLNRSHTRQDSRLQPRRRARISCGGRGAPPPRVAAVLVALRVLLNGDAVAARLEGRVAATIATASIGAKLHAEPYAAGSRRCVFAERRRERQSLRGRRHARGGPQNRHRYRVHGVASSEGGACVGSTHAIQSANAPCRPRPPTARRPHRTAYRLATLRNMGDDPAYRPSGSSSHRCRPGEAVCRRRDGSRSVEEQAGASRVPVCFLKTHEVKS